MAKIEYFVTSIDGNLLVNLGLEWREFDGDLEEFIFVNASGRTARRPLAFRCHDREQALCVFELARKRQQHVEILRQYPGKACHEIPSRTLRRMVDESRRPEIARSRREKKPLTREEKIAIAAELRETLNLTVAT